MLLLQPNLMCILFLFEEEMENEESEVDPRVFDDDEDLLDEDVVDLRSFVAMQPITCIELLELPPQQQQLNSWVMQQSEFCSSRKPKCC